MQLGNRPISFDYSRILFNIVLGVIVFTQLIPYNNAKQDKPAVVRIWFRAYSYPYKLKANRDWCNPHSRNEPCSPAFHLCFIQNVTSQNTCQAEVRFGGKSTVYVHRNTIRFGTALTRGIFNPIHFYLAQWKSYPTVNVTVTHENFDRKNNLLGEITLHMDKLTHPAPTRWIAKWHKTTLLLAGGKMKIMLSYQSYYTTPSASKKHMIQVRSETESAKSDSPGIADAYRENSTVMQFGATSSNSDAKHMNVDTPKIQNELSGPVDMQHDQESNPQVVTVSSSPALSTTTTTTIATEIITTAITETTTTSITQIPTNSTETTAAEFTTTTSSSKQLSDATIAGLTVGVGILMSLMVCGIVIAHKYHTRLGLRYRPLER